MKKTLIIAAFACMVFAACSSENKNGSALDSNAADSMTTAVDTTATLTDSTMMAADSAAVDSAAAAHGHKH